MAPATPAPSASAPTTSELQINDLVQALQGISLNNSNAIPKPHIADPEIFEGTKKEFPAWWRKMKMYLEGNKTKITTDSEKCMVVLSRLGGKLCASFSEAKIDRGLEDGTFGTWISLMQEITRKFTEPNIQENSEIKIESFRQGNQSIDDFITKFENLKDRAQTDDNHMVFLLQKYMNVEILRTLYKMPTLPSGYEQWKEAVLTLGRNQEIFEG